MMELIKLCFLNKYLTLRKQWMPCVISALSYLIHLAIKDFHLEKNDNHVVPITAVNMVKSVFGYTKSISYNKPKTENLMKQLGLSICETYSSELRLSELAFLFGLVIYLSGLI